MKWPWKKSEFEERITWVNFMPQPDLTVMELVEILRQTSPLGYSIAWDRKDWELLPMALKRHFTEVNIDSVRKYGQ